MGMTKLEQVAREIEVALLEHHASSSEVRAVAAARAAVEALRAPTEDMLNSGWQALPDAAPTKGDCATEDALMTDIWQEMIDAALGIERDRTPSTIGKGIDDAILSEKPDAS